MKIQRALFLTRKEMEAIKYALLYLVEKKPVDKTDEMFIRRAKKLLETYEEDKVQ